MQKKKIVTIGGGTGSFTLLSGLRNYNVDLTAIISMADDGGSTGVLRDELGVLPPGDVRQCLVALSDSSGELRELMTYRFESGSLKGHNFGNIFLSALEKVSGSFTKGIEEATRILNIRGQVLPVTEEDMRLFVELKNGQVIEGEDQINHSTAIQKSGLKRVFLNPAVQANPQVLKALRQADVICIGPGNHYGSVLPNLLVKGICEAIQESKAKIIYNCNLTNKKGQTMNWMVDDYVNFFEQYIGKDRVDYVMYNTKKIPKSLLEKYESREGRGMFVDFDPSQNPGRKYQLVKADIVSTSAPKFSKTDVLADTRAFIRHDSEKLAKALMLLLEFEAGKSIIKDIV